MKFISHRGNLTGPDSRENSVPFLIEALEKGFDVECDVWYKNKKLYLGHDTPEYDLEAAFLIEYKDKLWIHAKNFRALKLLSETFNTFYHVSDMYTITSKNYIWCHPNSKEYKNSIYCSPDLNVEKYLEFDKIDCLGVCSDYIKELKTIW